MAETFPLTCSFCRNAPATHLLVADLPDGRVPHLVCYRCGHRDEGAARTIAVAPAAAWLFELHPDACRPDPRPLEAVDG